MGSVIYSISLSVDGFVDTPERSLDWVLVDDELHTVFNDDAKVSAFLDGWRTYEPMTDSLRCETVGSPND